MASRRGHRRRPSRSREDGLHGGRRVRCRGAAGQGRGDDRRCCGAGSDRAHVRSVSAVRDAEPCAPQRLPADATHVVKTKDSTLAGLRAPAPARQPRHVAQLQVTTHVTSPADPARRGDQMRVMPWRDHHTGIVRAGPGDARSPGRRRAGDDCRNPGAFSNGDPRLATFIRTWLCRWQPESELDILHAERTPIDLSGPESVDE